MKRVQRFGKSARHHLTEDGARRLRRPKDLFWDGAVVLSALCRRGVLLSHQQIGISNHEESLSTFRKTVSATVVPSLIFFVAFLPVVHVAYITNVQRPVSRHIRRGFQRVNRVWKTGDSHGLLGCLGTIYYPFVPLEEKSPAYQIRKFSQQTVAKDFHNRRNQRTLHSHTTHHRDFSRYRHLQQNHPYTTIHP